jgi:hypothetical protein
MRTHSHLKTVAAMDELETAIFLPRAQTDAMLGLSTAAGNGNGKSDAACHHVVVCAGQVGVLRLYHVYYKPTASKGKGSNAAAAFTCAPLVNIAPSGPSLQHTISFRAGVAASSGNNDGDDDDDHKDRELAGGKAVPGSFTSVDNLIYRPSLADGEESGNLTVVTADQTFVTYALSSVVDEQQQQQDAKRKGKAGSKAGGGSGGLTFSLKRQLLGARDDILDMSILAAPLDGAVSSSSSSSVQAKTSFTAVVATNSPHLRALELSPKSNSSSSSSSCRLLYGHSDVVLAVSSAPNG